MPSRVLRIVLTSLCVAFPAWAAPNQKAKTLDVPLAWTPKEAPAVPVLDLTGGVYSFHVDMFTDAREAPSLIGENLEKKPPVSVRTSSDVASFVTKAVVRELTQLGVEMREQGAERILTGEITQFWVRDAGSYDATIRVKVTIRDASGTELWTGLATGRGENWGRQLKPINYTETLTTALQDLIAHIVGSPAFVKAIKRIP
jgi:hypothetical protein